MFKTTSLFYESSTDGHRWTEFLKMTNGGGLPASSSTSFEDINQLQTRQTDFPLLCNRTRSYKSLPLDDLGMRLIFSIGTLLVCLGMIGNIITALVIVKMKRLYSPTYVTIACLAVSDAMAASSRYILFLTFSMNNNLSILSAHFVGFLGCTSIHAANFHMVLLAYIRYAFIVKSL
jgi:hypothetical protein